MRLSWDDFKGESTLTEAGRLWIENREGYLREGIGMTFSGPYGTGKTMVAALVAKDLVKLGVPTHLTTYAAMVEMFAAGWRSREDQAWFERKVVDTKVLVLDDIGKEMKTALSETTFDHVMRARASNLRPTILTTNLTEKEINGRYGGGALSLLFERSVLVAVSADAEDYRTKARGLATHRALRGERTPIT